MLLGAGLDPRVKSRAPNGRVKLVERVEKRLHSASSISNISQPLYKHSRVSLPREAFSAYLDIVLPRLLQEQPDPVVILELMEEDDFDTCIKRRRI